MMDSLVTQYLAYLSRWLFDLKWYAASFWLSNQILKRNPIHAESFYQQALVLLLTNRIQQGIHYLKEKVLPLVQSHKSFARLYCIASDFYNKNHQPEKALEILETAQQVFPQHYLVDLYLARFYFSYGYKEKTEFFFDRIQTIESSQPNEWFQYYFLKAMIHIANERFLEAIHLFAWLGEIVFSMEIEIQKAYCHYKIRQLDDAEAIILAILKLRPNDIAIQFQRALIYEARGETEKAFTFFETLFKTQMEAFKNTPYNPEMAKLLKDPKLSFLYERITKGIPPDPMMDRSKLN